MAIWALADPAGLMSGLARSAGTVTSHPAPTHDFVLAAIAIAVWAIALAYVAVWLRARERAKAREHIRSISFSRRNGSGFRRTKQGTQQAKPHRSWAKSLAQP
jgi:prephenate dehydrogenase